ncbi:GNAT family N-acetyltransferase [Streptomyces sp. NPDC059788]|uniref:GNAT family N-acetyltransferase n=1 Tax=Streptomyces sp. NPDC059788 TaxID=3346948 RepID=UPI003653D6BB
MRVTVHEVRLTQRHVWRSAREAIPVQPGLVVEATHDGRSGFGEAAAFMTASYRSELPQLHADLRRVAPLLAAVDPYDDPARTWRTLADALPESPFVLAALDSAVHDLHARLRGVPLWESLGLDRPQGLRSSFSIGIDTESVMVHKLDERPGWPAYKVKLADPGDLTTLKALRQHTDAPFYVDGNCGWEHAPTLAALGQLWDLGVRLLEQPYPRDRWRHAIELKAVSPFPVIADESMTGPGDLTACARAFHGVNVKPMKAGGITPSLDILRRARERGLITMLGCMPESAAGVSATAHLGGLVDHLDVDVLDLLAVNTGSGPVLDGTGRVTLPDRTGSGYRPDPQAAGWSVRATSVDQIRPLRDLLPVTTEAGFPHAEADLLPSSRHYVALEAGRTVGTVTVHRERFPDADRDTDGPRGDLWRIRDLVTTPKARGTGAGTALLRTALTHTALAGATTVWCHAPGPAAGFLRRGGFTDAGRPGTGPHLMHWSPR